MQNRIVFLSLLVALQTAFANEGIAIALGSTNPVKLEALQNVVDALGVNDPEFANVSIETWNVSSEVGKQPKTLEETIRGAMNRAMNAHKCLSPSNCLNLGVGIESGIHPMKIKIGETSSFDFTACVVYDGKDKWVGLSCFFQLPSCVSELINDKEADLDLGQAMRLSGLTQKFEVGKEEGSIGVLTKGSVSRKDYTEQAIRMAFVPFQNRDLYGVSSSH